MNGHDAQIELIAGLADNKYRLGQRYAEWCTSAPALESAVAAAAMAQDEIGHARSLYPVLKELAGVSPENEPETRTHFTNVQFLDRPFSSWTDFVAANFLFDTALTVVLEAAGQSSLASLQQRANRMLPEEQLHWLHGAGWLRRLSGESAALSAALEASLQVISPGTDAWLEVAQPDLVEQGVLSSDTAQLRQTYSGRVNPLLVEAGLAPV
ncbi:MAG: Phenylacetic acid catabolic protein [Chloroflexota bacterium]